MILALAVPWEAHAEAARPREWWRQGGTLLCLCCVPWEIELSSQSPPQSSSLPSLIPDQEELDKEINNLRKELRVKVNRLYEAQGKRPHCATCSVPGNSLVYQEGPEIP